MFKDVGNFDIWHFYNFYSWTGKNKDIRAVFSQYLFWCFILHSLIPEHLCLPGAVWRVVPVDLHSSDVVRFWMEHHLTLALKQTTFLHSVVGSHTIPIMVQCGGHHFKLTWNTQKIALKGAAVNELLPMWTCMVNPQTLSQATPPVLTPMYIN